LLVLPAWGQIPKVLHTIAARDFHMHHNWPHTVGEFLFTVPVLKKKKYYK